MRFVLLFTLLAVAGCQPAPKAEPINIPARIHAMTMKLAEKRRQERQERERQVLPTWVKADVTPPVLVRKYQPANIEGALPAEFLQDEAVRIEHLTVGESCFVGNDDLLVNAAGLLFVNPSGLAYAGRSPQYCRHRLTRTDDGYEMLLYDPKFHAGRSTRSDSWQQVSSWRLATLADANKWTTSDFQGE